MHLLSLASMKNKALVALVTICIAIFGGVALSSLKTELTPELELPAVVVMSNMQGASPEIISADVTEPIERAVQSVQSLEGTSGTSSTGSSVVVAQFEYGVNMATTEQRVQQAVNRIASQLPEGVEPTVLTGSIADFPVLQLAVTGGEDTAALVDRIETIAVPQLERTEGVRAVQLQGAPGQRITISPDDEALTAAGLSRQSIRDAIDQQGQLLPGGTVDDDGQTLSVQIGERLGSVDDVANLPLTGGSEAGAGGQGGTGGEAGAGDQGGTAVEPGAVGDGPAAETVTIGDMAEVALTEDPVTSVALVDGQPSITLSITKTQASNTVDVSHAVHELLPAIQAELGDDVAITTILDQAPYIEHSIEALAVEGVLGLVFAVLVILIFLWSLRSTIVTAISIPMSVLMTFIGMWGAGFSLNVLTLGALTISIGRVVDDSIVVIENIKRHLAFQASKAKAILDAVREVAGAITASTVTTVIVFLPLAFVSDITGELFRPFALTVTIALLSSLVIALTIVPVLASWLLKRPKEAVEAERVAAERAAQTEQQAAVQPARRGIFGRRRASAPARGPLGDRRTRSGGSSDLERVHSAAASGTAAVGAAPIEPADRPERSDRLRRAYRPVLLATLRKPWLVLIGAVLVLGASGAAVPLMAINFLGDDGQTTVQLSQQLEPGASLDAQLDEAEALSAELQALDGVETVSATVSSGAGAFAAFTGGGGGSSVRYGVIAADGTDMEALRADILEIGDAATGEVTVGSSGGLGGSDITVEVQAPTPEALEAATASVSDRLTGLDGVAQVTDSLEGAQPLVQVAVDRELAASLGLSEAAVSGLVAQAMQPTPIGDIQLDGSLVRIWLDAIAPASTLDELRSLELPTPAGPLPLSDVAEVTEVTGPVSIATSDGSRTATVTVTPDAADVGGLSASLQAELDGLELAEGATAEIGGVATQITDAFTQLGIAALIAVLLVYVVMVATFKSLLQPFLLLVSVPFAATGAIAMQLITGVPLGVASMVGVLMLVGIVVTNAIVLIDLVNQYRDRGLSVREALVEGAERRLRPILMTAAATIFALVPMAAGLTGQGGFISQPLAIVVIGGLISSTVLTLIVLPVLYLVVEGAIERRRVRRGSGTRAERRGELAAASQR
ncbi:hydrophobic/amphiphilic exporter-1, HAE1 family [Agrococcus baldri]|uniref:Hydrophobic/amphiphilic exporter-1, HAE1 family n=1 Tax=Agrococcus baldri TaxID=153730 RepID=A0AA94KZ63_9MICO|nr:efflux RND transporter permease subunit [Agrococcus baldri]SFS07993.1 hydrophobic/amphiphilic exporter-1, HAE1 family [Agrococcus baldri]